MSLLYKLFVEWLSIEFESLVEWKPQKCLYPKKVGGAFFVVYLTTVTSQIFDELHDLCSSS